MINRDAPIVQCEILPLTVPVRMAFATSQETLEQADIVVVRLTDAAGNVALGEAAPFAAYTGDTPSQVTKILPGILALLRGHNVVQALADLDQHRPDIFAQTPSAFVAVETALLDLYARQRCLRFHELWGFSAASELRTDITMPIVKRDQVKDFCTLFADHDFGTFKIKVSGNVSEDAACVEELVKVAGKDRQYFLDGNQAYDVAGATKLVATLQKAGIKPLFFEQPLPRDDWKGASELSRSISIPVCLDESVTTSKDVFRVVEQKAATMLNLKIMKSGVRESVRIMQCGAAAGLKMMIGGMLESEIAMNTSLHIAAANTQAIQFLDLDTPFFLAKRITKASPWHRASSKLVLGRGMGSGLELSI